MKSQRRPLRVHIEKRACECAFLVVVVVFDVLFVVFICSRVCWCVCVCRIVIGIHRLPRKISVHLRRSIYLYIYTIYDNYWRVVHAATRRWLSRVMRFLLLFVECNFFTRFYALVSRGFLCCALIFLGLKLRHSTSSLCVCVGETTN